MLQRRELIRTEGKCYREENEYVRRGNVTEKRINTYGGEMLQRRELIRTEEKCYREEN